MVGYGIWDTGQRVMSSLSWHQANKFLAQPPWERGVLFVLNIDVGVMEISGAVVAVEHTETK